MDIRGFDHIVISTSNVDATIKFYTDVCGMKAVEERPRKWALHFAESKISLQDASELPDIARRTAPGTANFCLYTDRAMDDVLRDLLLHEIEVIAGPDERIGANGMILSVYFNDPEGNLVEVCNRLDA
jgi:catechol 2,3-dioxygenase-like lactoylglutathione lyase family enzyme